MTTIDPFISIPGSIAPLNIGNSKDEYSIKISTTKYGSKNAQINLYTGNFEKDIFTNAIGFQASIMTAIETIIQEMYEPSFLIGRLPSLGRPSYIFEPKDIIVSFADKNDYFIFRGNGSLRKVIFITSESLPEIYNPGNPGAITPYIFTSITNDLTYTVTYPEAGKFYIIDSRGREVEFDMTIIVPIIKYKNDNLIKQIIDSTGNITTTPSTTTTDIFIELPNYTSIGITILPLNLPTDPLDIITAEGVMGLFYNENVPTTSQDIIDYIFLQHPSLNISQKTCIIRLIKTIFSSIRKTIMYILNINNRNSFSLNNGFATLSSINGITLETKVT